MSHIISLCLRRRTLLLIALFCVGLTPLLYLIRETRAAATMSAKHTATLTSVGVRSYSQDAPQTPAADGDVDTSFNPGTGTDNPVDALALQGDGKIILGGQFTSYNGVSRNNIVRVNGDGSLDTSFNPGIGTNSAVLALALQNDGKIILGGKFSSYDGVPRNNIARANSDGSPDTSFNPGTGANGVVLALALQGDGKIIIGGQFTSYNGVSRNNIVRVNGDGSRDPSFNPGTEANGPVNAITLQSDGKIIIVGDFNSYDGMPRNKIARINSDGSPDTSFNPGTGANDQALTIALQSNGKIIIGGKFSSYNGVPRNNIARLNDDGSLDTSFNPGTGTNGPVNALTPQPDGKIILGGQFTNYDGVSRNNLARLNGDGSPDTSFNPSTGANGPVNALTPQSDGKIILGGKFSSYDGVLRNNIARVLAGSTPTGGGDVDTSFNPGTGTDNPVDALAVQPDGKIILGGQFTSYNGVSRNNIARLNDDGSLDPSFNPGTGLDTLLNLGTGPSSKVNALALQGDGKIIIGGQFASYDGVSRNNIVRVNRNGSLDPSFNPGAGASAPVSAISMQGDGKIIVGGQFTSYNGASRNSVARVNGDGSLDTSFNPGGGASAGVSAISMQSDGKIILGGQFTSYNGASRNSVARVNGDGSLDTTFNPGAGASGPVSAIAMQSDGKIILGGQFSRYDGASRGKIARVKNDGSLDTSFNPGTGADAGVSAIAMQGDGKLVIVGDFNSYNDVPRNHIARVNSDGSLDASFNPGAGTNAGVSAISMQGDGRIIVVGDFTSYNGVPRNHIARILAGLGSAFPGVLFSQSSYSVNESAQFAAINVTRAGDTSAAATVKYATSDATGVDFQCNPTTPSQLTGAASRKCDYHIAVGRLRFAPGETTKQLVLSLVDDAYVESPETLTITLSSPTGVSLGSPSVATLTITDNDASGAANPIDGTAFYVRQLYVDLLSREPDPAGQQGWIDRIDLCGQPGQPPPPCDRVTVGGDGFLRSDEFFDRQFFVIRLYRAGLGRILRYEDVGDLAYVSGFLSAADLELNKQELVAEIMSRSEFSHRYDGLQNGPFVDLLIQTAGVTIPQSIRDGWVTALNNSTKTRAQVYRELSERAEVTSRYLHEAQVTSCYYGFFTRNPDDAYFDFLARLDSGQINLGDLANAFINASEYRQRFGP
jgi:uncharacterized delta-60 repeat protein